VENVTTEATPNDTSGEDAFEPTPHKVHIRGLDNFTHDDIKAFASEYFPAHKPERIEWINDTSANLIYDTPQIAQEGLQAFSDSDASHLSSLQTVPAKSFPKHPDTHLEVRLAVIGDRKKARASAHSRFYLNHPEYDPANRSRGGRSYRDREDGTYRSQRYDDREHRKRRDDDESAGFDVNLYDDDEAALEHRARRNAWKDSSRSDSRERVSRRARGTAGKELFPDRDRGSSGRLRDRSASPARNSDVDRDTAAARDRKRDSAAAANRLKAQKIKEQLRQGGTTKELFPHKVGVQHRRSDAFDAADETADLFANKMAVPLLDGAEDRSYASKVMRESELGRFNIRGTAKAFAKTDFTIKGTAPAKELFPARDNAGKELFASQIKGRGLSRQKAGDLFD
jgi:hypothetical protein